MKFFVFFFPLPWDRNWIGLRVMMVLLCGVIPVCSTGRVQFGKVETGSGDIPEAASCCGHAKKGGSGPLRHR